METIEKITRHMGTAWVEKIKEQATHSYTRLTRDSDRDLSKREYINSCIRHAYVCVQQATNSREGAD